MQNRALVVLLLPPRLREGAAVGGKGAVELLGVVLLAPPRPREVTKAPRCLL